VAVRDLVVVDREDPAATVGHGTLSTTEEIEQLHRKVQRRDGKSQFGETCRPPR
jgi:hypothetical protein